VTALAEVLPLTGTLDLVGTCRPMIDAAGDPAWEVSAGRVRRGLNTPDGPAGIDLRLTEDGLEVTAYGDGASWIAPRVPRMVGLEDSSEGFEPRLHPLVGRLAATRPWSRIGASLRLWDAVVPVVLGQRVTVGEARRSWWRLVRRHGSPAPGLDGIFVAPTPQAVARVSLAEWHRMGVERNRAETIRRVISVLPALERAAAHSSEELQRAITTVPGVGPWTATALAAGVLGDPDAVLLGDLHLPHHVCWALAREPRGSDARMVELLEPWRGHRGRVVRLLRGSGNSAPRRGPRYNPLPFERW
jgi:3-methyladenine DNA glycosylase/8-oxoguanine DNA glycosylase